MASVTTGPIATTTNGTDNAIVWFTSNGGWSGVDGDTGAEIVSNGNCSERAAMDFTHRRQRAYRGRR